MKVDPSVRALITDALLKLRPAEAIDKRLRALNILGHLPYQDVFLNACTSAEEKAAMQHYIYEVGTEHIASSRILGDGDVSKYNLRDLYTLEFIWPSVQNKEVHPADIVLGRLAARRDQFWSEVARARAKSQSIVRVEGDQLLSKLSDTPQVDSRVGRWRLLASAIENFMPDVDGLITSKSSVGDLEPFLTIPLNNEWGFVTYFQRAGGFVRAGSETGFDIQSAVTQLGWIAAAGGRVPIPHGIVKLQVRESLHGLRSAYLSSETAALTLAAVRSYAEAVLQLLPALKIAFSSIVPSSQ